MLVRCKSFKGIDNTVKSILVFGLVRPVMSNTWNYEEYCIAMDEKDGTLYGIYSEYDPCLKQSGTIAKRKTEDDIKKWISEYLNDGWITETEYIELYNRFAKETNNIPLSSIDSIYTDENKQDLLIEHIMKNRIEYRNVFECM